jgi:hypothetical protein
MRDSNIVIACHCKVHEHLYHVKADGKKGNIVGDGAIYIDPHACPEKPWSTVASNSVDFVWGENCSVYLQLTHGLQLTKKGHTAELKNGENDTFSNRNLFRLLDESYRVLKTGGKVIFGDFLALTQNVIDNAAKINAHPRVAAHYTLEIVPALGYQIHLAQTFLGKFIPKTYLYVFTKKPSSGGKRKTRTTKLTRKNM